MKRKEDPISKAADSLSKAQDALLALLKELQWSGETRGQGWGFMGSGNDGTPFPSCPVCHGLKPGTGAEREFEDSAIGHRPDCKIKKALKRNGA